MLVGKLEKLDKLDELLRKIDAMKVWSQSFFLTWGAFSSLHLDSDFLFLIQYISRETAGDAGMNMVVYYLLLLNLEILVTSSGRSYSELKKDLEELQKIIIDAPHLEEIFFATLSIVFNIVFHIYDITTSDNNKIIIDNCNNQSSKVKLLCKRSTLSLVKYDPWVNPAITLAIIKVYLCKSNNTT